MRLTKLASIPYWSDWINTFPKIILGVILSLRSGEKIIFKYYKILILTSFWLLFGGGGLFAQLCPDSCDPVNCSLPDSSVHKISQARILEWAAISFSKGPPDSGIKPSSPALQEDSLLPSHQGRPSDYCSAWSNTFFVKGSKYFQFWGGTTCHRSRYK